MPERDIAESIIHRLHAAGYQAYLVGGCVRDLLLGRQPKDFDVATDANPTHLRQLFPHAQEIGAHFSERLSSAEPRCINTKDSANQVHLTQRR